MGISEYLLLIGAFLTVPICYDLFKVSEGLKEVIKNKKKAAEILLLSVSYTGVVWVLLKIYLMVIQLQLSTKY